MADAAELRARLVAQLRVDDALHDHAVAEAFAAVPREHFLPDVPADEVYVDRAFVTRREHGIPVSSSSQPAIMAIMLEQLDVRPGARVLEIGTGTGYNAALLALLALLARLVGADGAVTSVELDRGTAEAARGRLAAADTAATVNVVAGDGLVGAPRGAPYDRIIVTAGATEIPRAWVDQLSPSGRLVVPFRLNATQAIFALDRDGADLVSAGAAAGGFMPLRTAGHDTHVGVLPDGSRVTADVPLDHTVLVSIAAHWDEARPAALPMPMPMALGESYPARLVVALQGAPIYGVDRWAGDELTNSAAVLATSTRSAVRWTLSPPGARAPEVLGSDEALDFVRAALMRWRLEGEPGVESLR
ncbi:MAG: hypothetical protein O2843_09560, partial [Chloroflexi bacterium]|nr:hypothetical protein [Chloroflexota bacterium]